MKGTKNCKGAKAPKATKITTRSKRSELSGTKLVALGQSPSRLPRSPKINKEVRLAKVAKNSIKRKIILNENEQDDNNNAKPAKAGKMKVVDNIATKEMNVVTDQIAHTSYEQDDQDSHNSIEFEQDHVNLVVNMEEI